MKSATFEIVLSRTLLILNGSPSLVEKGDGFLLREISGFVVGRLNVLR